MFAKLALSDEPRSVILELSLEYQENPLIDSEEQARQILSSDFLIESESGTFAVADLNAPINWSVRDHLDEFAPIPAIEPEEDDTHQWLVAEVDLSGLEADSISLHVDNESLQAVIFWVDEEEPNVKEVSEPLSDVERRVFLIAGDRSMPVALPTREPKEKIGRAWLVLAAGLMGLAIWWLARKHDG